MTRMMSWSIALAESAMTGMVAVAGFLLSAASGVESLIHASRSVAEMLGTEDLFDLETRAALDDLGQRLAHRQVLRAAAALEASLPRHRVRPLGQTREVATHLFEEDEIGRAHV